MKTLAVALLGAGLVIAQTNPVTDAYLRGVELGNQQNAIAVYCLSYPSCVAAMQEAQARKEQAKADAERLKAEARARREQAKIDKERRRAEITLAKLQLKLQRESAKAPRVIESGDK